jgi:beta-1,4-mannosyl-glycoprotein beta-1,4-N-acetylglucosaminyltransferase
MPTFLFNRRWAKVLVSTTLFTLVLLFYYRLENGRHIIHETALNAAAKGFKTDALGFMALPEAEEYCRAHKWKPYPERSTRRKVYDLFMMNIELDWLEIRLNELKDHVDYFVILESASTFTGLPKPLYLKDNWEQFSAFHDQIIYQVLNDTGFYSTITWDHEDLQRNAMFNQVFPNLFGEQQASLGDVILVSDIDEMPRPATLQVLRNCQYPRRLTLHSRFYYYSFQWLHRGAEWPHPQATIYEGNKTIRPANLRNGEGGNIIQIQLDKADLWNAAWHCSFCFATLEGMINKISSFSHTRLNRPEFRDPEEVVRRVRNGLDLFDRKDQYYDRVELNADIPKYMETHKEQFSYILDRDPPNANFRDYNMLNESSGEAVTVS